MSLVARNVAFLLAALWAFTACSQDPFHLSYRTVAGAFVLHQWEDGKTYYLEDKDHDSEKGGGVLDGIVTEIGWNANYIVARRHAIFGGDADGWMVVDVQRRSVRGPYNDHQIREIPEMEGIHVLSADRAWKELH